MRERKIMSAQGKESKEPRTRDERREIKIKKDSGVRLERM
jgi:hypothetical protein